MGYYNSAIMHNFMIILELLPNSRFQEFAKVIEWTKVNQRTNEPVWR
jgi:hypothetical protein